MDRVTGETGRIRGEKLQNSCAYGSGEGKLQDMKEEKWSVGSVEVTPSPFAIVTPLQIVNRNNVSKTEAI